MTCRGQLWLMLAVPSFSVLRHVTARALFWLKVELEMVAVEALPLSIAPPYSAVTGEVGAAHP